MGRIGFTPTRSSRITAQEALRLASFCLLSSSVFCAAASNLSAAEVVFGESASSTGWNTLGVATSGPAQQVATFTDTTTSSKGPILFELSIDAPNTIKAAEGDLKVKGGSGGSRIDSGTDWSTDADDEWVLLTLNISGAGAQDLASINFGGISLLTANRYDEVEFSDGSSSHTENWPDTGFLSYTTGSPLENLTPLTLDNVGNLGDGSWQLKLTARDFLYNGSEQQTTEFRIGQVKLNYEAIRLSDVFGVAHAGAKYYVSDTDSTLTSVDSLNEGAEQIERLGSSVMKVFMGKNYEAKNYVWNMNWPVTPVSNLVELAQTTHFSDLFSRPGIHTFVIDSHSFAVGKGIVKWKDGMTASEIQQVETEIYDLVLHLRNTYSNKTFILQNWEGDNAYSGYGAVDDSLAEPGMIAWFNARQDAIDDAKAATPNSTAKVWGAVEFNWLPQPYYPDVKAHYIIDTVIPSTYADLYSLSSWSTGKNNGNEDNIFAMFEYMDSKCPDSAAFGADNLYLGEFGAAENQITDTDGAAFATALEREHAQVGASARQVEQALLAGARYILFWCVYDNEEKGTYTFSYPTEAENDDLKGLWLVRPDGTLPELYNYCKSILSTPIDDYVGVYEVEHQGLEEVSVGDSVSKESNVAASAGSLCKLEADAAYTDHMIFGIHVPEAGTYDVEVSYQAAPDAGAFRLFISGNGVGDPVDCYSPTESIVTSMVVQSQIFTAAGVKNFKFRSLPKNANSSGFNLYIDSVRLIKQ